MFPPRRDSREVLGVTAANSWVVSGVCGFCTHADQQWLTMPYIPRAINVSTWTSTHGTAGCCRILGCNDRRRRDDSQFKKDT